LGISPTFSPSSTFLKVHLLLVVLTHAYAAQVRRSRRHRCCPVAPPEEPLPGGAAAEGEEAAGRSPGLPRLAAAPPQLRHRPQPSPGEPPSCPRPARSCPLTFMARGGRQPHAVRFPPRAAAWTHGHVGPCSRARCCTPFIFLSPSTWVSPWAGPLSLPRGPENSRPFLNLNLC
jgi:hypothetical protein